MLTFGCVVNDPETLRNVPAEVPVSLTVSDASWWSRRVGDLHSSDGATGNAERACSLDVTPPKPSWSGLLVQMEKTDGAQEVGGGRCDRIKSGVKTHTGRTQEGNITFKIKQEAERTWGNTRSQHRWQTGNQETKTQIPDSRRLTNLENLTEKPEQTVVKRILNLLTRY